LLIDFYGTIAAGDREAVEATCLRIVEDCGLPITAPDFAVIWGERYFATVGRSNHDAFQTLYQCELTSLRDTLADFGHYPDPAPFLIDLEEYWHNPPVHEDALEFLHELDIPVCCVSNADNKPLLSAIARHDLRFDFIVSSEAVRCYKPDPGIFRYAMRTLGVQPDRVLHVGDSLHSDIAGATGVGITSVWIRRVSRIHDIGVDQASFTIRSLAELTQLLA
jgi:2-haloacid dehalogenase/putative hydrolase of the HAD superfamily